MRFIINKKWLVLPLLLAGILIGLMPANVFASGTGIDWSRTTSSPGDEIASKIVLDSSSTYVYAAGALKTATNGYDYIILKYDAITGVAAPGWPVTYNNAPVNGDDIATALAVDSTGVYVTGKSYNGTDNDYLTVKYALNGTELWKFRYNGGVGNDEPRSLTVDGSGNVYVTGISIRNENRQDGCSDCGVFSTPDIATVAYNSSGVMWVNTFDGIDSWPCGSSRTCNGGGTDAANAIAVDTAGNVYVTGISSGAKEQGGDPEGDYITIKYSPSGTRLWAVRYDGAGYTDEANGLVIDPAGNVYVTGRSKNNAENADYATVKYNADGVQQWVKRYDGGAKQNDEARAISIDSVNDIYVAGIAVEDNPFTAELHDSTITTNGSGKTKVTGLVVDANPLTDDYMITFELHDSTITTNGSGNITVTGLTVEGNTFTLQGSTITRISTITTIVRSEDYVTFKYGSSNGDLLWEQHYNNDEYMGSDRAYAVSLKEISAADSAIYITGTSSNMYVNLKYSLTGTLIWTVKYSPNNRIDIPASIAVDDSGNAYVTGISISDNNGYDLVVFRDALDDTDHDGLPDIWEINYFGSISVINNKDGDEDGDGLSNITEYKLGTTPNNYDSDGDGMPDDWEVANKLDPMKNDADKDSDHDGYSNLTEYQNGTNPLQAQKTYFVDAAYTDSPRDGSISRPFKTIEEALNKVQADDVIRVFPGTYTVGSNLIIPESVRILGQNWYACIIDLQNIYQIQFGSYSTLRGFDIINPSATDHALLVGNAGSVTITNNVIEGNHNAQEGVAAISIDGGSAQIVNNTIWDGNTALLTNAANGTVIYNNIISANKYSLFDVGNSLMERDYNDFWQNLNDPILSANDINQDPLFIDTAKKNFHLPKLPAPSPCINKGNPDPHFKDKDLSRNDMGADGGPYGNYDNVPPSVQAAADPMNGYSNLNVNFSGTAVDEWGIASWSWDFDSQDGISKDSESKNVSHTYTDCGGYIATLTVTDRSGNQSTTTVERILVDTPPTVSISSNYQAGNAPLKVNFTSQVINGSGNYDYQWDFGNADKSDDVSDQANPSYTYTKPGRYTVTLVVTDRDSGCKVPVTTTVTVVDSSLKLKMTGKANKNKAKSVSWGSISLEIPADALPQDTIITISEVVNLPSLSAGAESTDIMVDFGPEGLKFSKPVSIALPYADNIVDPNKLQVCYYDKDKKVWVGMEIKDIDTTNKLIWAETTHFSTFALLGIPAAPSNLTANVDSETQVTLFWSDTSSNETGFKIERRTSDQSVEAYTEIASVPANTTSYVDKSVTAKIKYYYRVKAYNDLGESGYSNEVAVVTVSSSKTLQGTSSGGGSSSGCFIATAAYGTPMAKQVRILSRFRDEFLLTNSLGAQFVKLYYRYSPPIADFIAQREYLRQAVRIGLYPLIGFSVFMLELSGPEKLVVLLLMLAMLGGILYCFKKARKSAGQTTY